MADLTLAAAKVLRGYMALTEAERNSIVPEMNRYANTAAAERTVQKRDIERGINGADLSVNFGPAPGGCPCCGR